MEKYTTYCTTEQTQRALELGTPLESGIAHGGHWSGEERPFIYRAPKPNCIAWNNSSCWFCPTTQQMLGWLREKGFRIDEEIFDDNEVRFTIFKDGDKSWRDTVKIKDDKRNDGELEIVSMALNYLEQYALEHLFDDECRRIINSLTDAQLTEISGLMSNNSILQATKYVAEQTKCGLKFAKMTVDYLKEREGEL